jgi:hypothetical protein
MHRHMMGNTDTKKNFMWLKGRPLRSGLENHMANQVKESSLKEII